MPRRASLATVVGRGDYRGTLEALRDLLAREIGLGPPPRDLAALVARLQAVLADLDALPLGKDVDPADDLIARRAARQAAARDPVAETP